MNIYISALGAISVLFLSMINLGYFKVTIKEFISIIFISQCFNIIILLLNLGEFIAMIPMVITMIVKIQVIKAMIVLAIGFDIISILPITYKILNRGHKNYEKYERTNY